MSISAKTIREDIARAKSYSQRGDLLRCLTALCSATEAIVTSGLVGRDKFEVSALLDEALRELNSVKVFRRALPQGLVYQRGQEKKLFVILCRLRDKLAEAIEKAKIERERKRMAELDDLLIEAADLLKKKDPLDARKNFRKAADKYKDIPGLLSDIGTRMMMGGLPYEAIEYLNRALEVNPKDVRGHNSLIMCYEGLGDVTKTEESLREALRILGGNEVFYIKLAKISLTQRKWESAINAAQAVLKSNPLNLDARKIVKAASGKIYRNPSVAATASSNSAKKVRKNKEIKLGI